MVSNRNNRWIDTVIQRYQNFGRKNGDFRKNEVKSSGQYSLKGCMR